MWMGEYPNAVVVPVRVKGLPRGAGVEVQIRCFGEVGERTTI